jgi:feruloyl esterase
MTRLTVLCVTLALSAPSTDRTSDGAAVPLARVPETVSAAPCESLRSVLAGVTSATPTLAGPFQPLSATGDAAARAIEIAQPFCRVALVLRPSSDSEIHVELWLPDAGWNGKFQAVGNGAFNGAINYSAMAAALRRGYAVASTDTGHAGGGAAWALGHPEKVIDFGWRAVHEMVVASKRMVTAYYQAPLRYSYWNGCSAGGRQALKAVQRFPGDFDGVIAGAPGLDWTGRGAQANRIAKMLEANAAARLTAADRQLLHNAVLAACDARDGVKDGLLENPAACTYDPAALSCSSSDGDACLAPAKVETARQIYASALNSASGRAIPGLARGSELGWTDLGWTASARATGLDQFRFLVFADPRWTLQQFDFARDIVLAEERDGGTINALDANIEPFFRRGGKLIQYHGWSDPQISPFISTQYYERVVSAIGGAGVLSESYRLFMAPGMGHCSGGEGPNAFDVLDALDRWVESSKAPDAILASHSTGTVVDRTRPLCPYPQVAAYSGSGSTDDGRNFTCKAPAR